MRRIVWVVGAISLALAMHLKPAGGFVIDDALTNGTPNYPEDDLLDASRWSHSPGSFVDDGVRGLGNGLEYSVASDFCQTLIPNFIDTPKPQCRQLKGAIQSAFSAWSSEHAVLKFTDITQQVSPALPPKGSAEPWAGYGAEIDFFALTPSDYSKVTNVGANTSFWYVLVDPIGTHGQVLPGNTLTSADIVFNAHACYHLDAELGGQGCNHFESLVLHEIGHTLALDHPNEFPERNFVNHGHTSSSDSENCLQPRQRYRLSQKIDPSAVMNSSLGEAAPIRIGLSADDATGLQFLYPTCF